MRNSLLRRLLVVAALGGGLVLAWLLFRPAPSATAAAGDRAYAAAGGPAPAPAAGTAGATSATTGNTAPAAAGARADASFASRLDAARRIPDVRQRMREFGELLATWLAQDREAALAYVRGLPPGREFTQGLLQALGVIGRTDPDRALVLAAELARDREQRAIYSSLFAQLAEQDPAGAVRRLALVPAGDGRDNALRALGSEWARRDFSAAWEWSRQLGAADQPAGAESVLSALLTTDPLRAIQLAQQTLTGAPLNRTLSGALRALTPADPAAAAAIVALLPPGEVQTFAAFDVARTLAARDPREAVAWIRNLPAGDPQRLALNNVLEVWSRQDPAAAGAYVAQLPTGPALDAAAEHLARVVGARAPQTAIAWAQGLASATARDAALIAIGSAWAQHEPAAATAWAAGLPAGAVQSGAVAGAFSYWRQRDAAAADAWLASAGLAPELQARLRPTGSR